MLYNLSRRKFFKTTLMSLLAFSKFGSKIYSAQIKSNRKPNFIFILADDLGYGDLECTGHPYVKTPNINKLAKEGSLFTQFYVVGPTCSPSRIGFMTGLFPNRFEKHPKNYGFGKHTTVTQLLNENGYKNCHVGKWHIGNNTAPEEYGIDHYTRGRQKDPRGRDAGMTDKALEFITKNRNAPFYMNIWLHSPHPKIDPPEIYKKRYDRIKVNLNDFQSKEMQTYLKYTQNKGFDINKCMQAYCADVAALDEQVGRFLDKLDELNLAKNTIVVFSSDNGPSTGLHTKKDKDRIKGYRQNEVGSPGIFRGRKHSLYDGGVHTPFIIRWPGKVPAEKVDSTSVLAGVDWLPTVCSIAGINTKMLKLDGEDVSDILLGKSRPRKKMVIFQQYADDNKIAMREGKWKIHTNKNGKKVELYDLLKDPSEKNNMYKKNPEITKKLLSKITEYKNSLPSIENRKSSAHK